MRGDMDLEIYNMKKVLKSKYMFLVVCLLCMLSGMMIFSNSASAKTKKKPLATKIRSIYEENKVITLKWKKIKKTKGYIIYRATKKNGKFKKIKTIKNSKITIYKDAGKDIGFKEGKTYFYRIATYNVIKKKKYISLSKVKSKKIPVKKAPQEKEDTKEENTKLELNYKSMEMLINDSVQLGDKNNKIKSESEIKWTSSNPLVAEVNTSGKITALSKGSCEIEAKNTKGETDTCKIMVSELARKEVGNQNYRGIGSSPYGGWHWSRPQPLAYYMDSANNFYTVFYDGETSLYIYKYSSEFTYISQKRISLPAFTEGFYRFGGFYHGEDGCFYVAVGTSHYAQDDTREETYCIIKYNNGWEELDRVNINREDSDTKDPYIAGCSMAMKGTTLVIYTSKIKINGHEGSIMIVIDTVEMEVLSPENTVDISHSMSQYVKFDGEDLLLLDHFEGDPAQGAVILWRLTDFPEKSWEGNVLVELASDMEGNYTGTTVMGLETGVNGYLVAGSSVPHQNAIDGITGLRPFDNPSGTYARNVYLTIGDIDFKSAKFIWLTEYNPMSSEAVVGDPRIVKINDNKFAVIYGIEKKGDYSTEIIFVDANGNILSQETANCYFPSSSQPVVYVDKIVWLAPENMKSVSEKHYIYYLGI